MALSQIEVAQTIRSAIKEKLVAINVFVDDELPDYIMVLVANKRSKSHMEKDLSLFLGTETVSFTNWLWDFVNSFKGGSQKLDGASKSDAPKSKSKTVGVINVEEDSDVLDYDPDEQDNLDLDEPEKSAAPSAKSKVTSTTKDTTKSADKPKEMQIVAPVPPLKSEKPVAPKQAQNFPVSSAVIPVQTTQKSAKVYPVQSQPRIVPVPRPSRIPAFNPDDQYDPTRPDLLGSVSSVVCVAERKYAGPVALTANKILQRAVNDAAKSILNGQSIEDYYKPTPINILSKRNANRFADPSNLVTVKIDQSLNFDTQLPSVEYDPCPFDINHSDLSSLSISEVEPYMLPDTPITNRSICLPIETPDIVFEDETENPIISMQPAEEPHFFVTLDGVDFESLKRKRSFDSEEEDMEVDESIDDMSPEKKQKIPEKCKYWPACKNDECAYHHPSVPCKNFPNCNFGDKCLYVHPNCKFDSLCTRKDCSFTHASKRKFNMAPVHPVIPMKMKSAKAACKFYPHCTAVKCPFIHPKMCRYGTKCRAPACLYSHPSIPSRDQMKWKAETLS